MNCRNLIVILVLLGFPSLGQAFSLSSLPPDSFPEGKADFRVIFTHHGNHQTSAAIRTKPGLGLGTVSNQITLDRPAGDFWFKVTLEHGQDVKVWMWNENTRTPETTIFLEFSLPQVVSILGMRVVSPRRENTGRVYLFPGGYGNPSDNGYLGEGVLYGDSFSPGPDFLLTGDLHEGTNFKSMSLEFFGGPVVPEPGTLLLVGSGLLSLALQGRRS